MSIGAVVCPTAAPWHASQVTPMWLEARRAYAMSPWQRAHSW